MVKIWLAHELEYILVLPHCQSIKYVVLGVNCTSTWEWGVSDSCIPQLYDRGHQMAEPETLHNMYKTYNKDPSLLTFFSY